MTTTPERVVSETDSCSGCHYYNPADATCGAMELEVADCVEDKYDDGDEIHYVYRMPVH